MKKISVHDYTHEELAKYLESANNYIDNPHLEGRKKAVIMIDGGYKINKSISRWCDVPYYVLESPAGNHVGENPIRANPSGLDRLCMEVRSFVECHFPK